MNQFEIATLALEASVPRFIRYSAGITLGRVSRRDAVDWAHSATDPASRVRRILAVVEVLQRQTDARATLG